MELLLLVFGLLATADSQVRRGDADIEIKYAETCGVGFLRRSQSPRVRDPETFYGRGPEGDSWSRWVRGRRRSRQGRRRAKVSFRYASVEIRPSRGRHFRIPGCMTLEIRNVTVERRIQNIAAEYQMRVAGRPDPTRPKIDCATNRGTSLNECTCGTKNNCLFCSFCENIQNRQVLQERDRGRMSLLGAEDRNDFGEANEKCGRSCPRTEERGLLDMTADICTPSTEEMEKHLDADAMELLATERMSMFTAVWLYERKGRNRAASAVRNMDVVGCFLLGYDVAISQDFKERLARKKFQELLPSSSSDSRPDPPLPPFNRPERNKRTRRLRVRHGGD